MSHQAYAHVLLLQPLQIDVLRALLLNLNILPVEHAHERAILKALGRQLEADPHCFAVLSLEFTDRLGLSLLDLPRLFTPAQIKRVFLVQVPRAQLLPQMRTWVLSLGFADILPEIEPAVLGTGANNPAQRMAAMAHVAFNALQAARYFSGMGLQPDQSSPRGLIRRQTGLDAESLAHLWASSVRAIERSYRLKRYPACFLGAEAVAWASKHFALSTADAVSVGQALQELGLLHHVTHEHDFKNTSNFYRTGISNTVDRIQLRDCLRAMVGPDGLVIADRSHRGARYPACFIGSQAVAWAASYYQLAPHQAEVLLNRLLALGLIEHVTKEHRVRNGHFFYRLKLGRQAAGSAPASR
jgi:Domain found in Dishevelled, Egl-10, and Pleckstrin (DEP)